MKLCCTKTNRASGKMTSVNSNSKEAVTNSDEVSPKNSDPVYFKAGKCLTANNSKQCGHYVIHTYVDAKPKFMWDVTSNIKVL